jgi:hypothetical protein
MLNSLFSLIATLMCKRVYLQVHVTIYVKEVSLKKAFFEAFDLQLANKKF